MIDVCENLIFIRVFSAVGFPIHTFSSKETLEKFFHGIKGFPGEGRYTSDIVHLSVLAQF